MIGTVDPAAQPRMTSMPSMPGRPRSRITTSAGARRRDGGRSPVGAVSTSYRGRGGSSTGPGDLRLVVDHQHPTHDATPAGASRSTSAARSEITAVVRRPGRLLQLDASAHGFREPRARWPGRARRRRPRPRRVAEPLEGLRTPPRRATGRRPAGGRSITDSSTRSPICEARTATARSGGDQVTALSTTFATTRSRSAGSARTRERDSGTSSSMGRSARDRLARARGTISSSPTVAGGSTGPPPGAGSCPGAFPRPR